MAVSIRLKKMGTIRKPFYRLVIIDKKISPKGAYIESIGHYHPRQKPKVEKVNTERALYWLKKGAVPSESVLAILKRCGIMKELKKSKT